MDQTTVFNGLIILVIALLGILAGGGIAAFVTIGRQNKANLELAYKALPPDWQMFIRELVTGVHSVADLADEVTAPATTTANPGGGQTITVTVPPATPVDVPPQG